MPKFIIMDWAGNLLNHKGRFEPPCFAVAKEFPSFEDAWGYLYEKCDHLPEKEFNEQMGEFYVEENKRHA